MFDIVFVSADPRERDVFGTVSRFFSDLGHKVEVLDSGRCAAERIQLQPPDVLVTDFLMADYDGVDLIRMQKNLYSGKSSSILLVAYSAEVGAITLVQRNLYDLVDAWIVKPFLRDQSGLGGGMPKNYLEQIIVTISQIILLREGRLTPD